jgi:hypothetical protein
MTSTVLERETPATLNIPDFDDLDAFDAKEDDLPYVFSPDAIREELAKNMPEEWDDHINLSCVEGTPFDRREQNLSVSTLDIGPNAMPPRSPEETSEYSTADSSNSFEFSHIPLSTSVESNVDSPLDESQRNGISKPHSGIVRQGRPQSLDLKLQPPSLPSARIDSPRQDSSGLPTPSPGSVLLSATSSTPKSSDFTRSPASDLGAGTSTSVPNMLSAAPPVLLTEKPFSHRPHRSAGPSAFEKVRSKTRPTFLPPKPRKEDEKHMFDWQQMMRQSRLVGESGSALILYFFTKSSSISAEKRHKALQDRRLARERAIENTLPIWEREILPNWRIVHKNPDLRRLWWRGIPTKLRASLWEQAVGNSLALSKGNSVYKWYLEAFHSSIWPTLLCRRPLPYMLV